MSTTFSLTLPTSSSPIHSQVLQFYLSHLKKNIAQASQDSFQIHEVSDVHQNVQLPTLTQQGGKLVRGAFAILLHLERHYASKNVSDGSLLRFGSSGSVERANAYAYTQLSVADVRNNLTRFNDEFLRFKTFALGNTLSIADFYLFAILNACQSDWMQNSKFVSIKRYFIHVHNLLQFHDVNRILGGPPPQMDTALTAFKFNPVPAIHQKPDAPAAAAAAKGGDKKKPNAATAAQGKGAKGGADKAAQKLDAKKDKKEKKAKKAKPQPKAQTLSPNCIDIRVGKIVEAKMHPEAEKLYIEQIDIGEDKPRTIVSGLFQKIPLEKLQGSLCLVMVNLKPAVMVGVESNGMLLSAVSADGKFDTLQIPEGTPVGERVTFAGSGKDEPEKQVNSKKLKKYLPNFKTNSKGQVVYEGSIENICRTTKGVVMSPFQNGLVA